ncbi:hypothetical protein C2845_PM03G04170 [Panicum miliaceum]|uniref:Uncharacterized protein n=1 Tax=Panicum miliaceum TaxID=4540 RepID=A0A3L6TDY4_PANMI|nr:hypothetical protein C2845_PM03G04170 [Panicum miliaceum]
MESGGNLLPLLRLGGVNLAYESLNRSTLLCTADEAPEESLKKTIEVDRLIDMLGDANPSTLDQIVAENVLALKASFWVWLAVIPIAQAVNMRDSMMRDFCQKLVLILISDKERWSNAAPENEWSRALLHGLTVGKRDVSPDELYAVLNKRTESVNLDCKIHKECGSYQQRVLAKFLKGIQSRAGELVKVLQGPTSNVLWPIYKIQVLFSLSIVCHLVENSMKPFDKEACLQIMPFSSGTPDAGF